MQKVRDLSQELIAKGDAETAKRLAFESGQLAALFSSIRANAERVAESAQALAGLRNLLPPPPRLPHLPPILTGFEEAGPAKETPPSEKMPASEGTLASEERLASQEIGEESFRMQALDILGRTGPTTTAPPAAPAARSSNQGDKNQFDLGQFFSNVSQSVVDAQRELDVASMRYARERTNSPVPPALYSIPTVHAEIKAGLSSTDGNGILVKLISDESQSSFTESTISFDIVSSPPPPGPLGNFTAAVPRFLAVEGPDYDRVIEALGKIQPALLQDWEKRTVIVRDLDPALAALNQTVVLAFVFGPVPAPPAGSATDYSKATFTVYRFSDADGATAVNNATPEVVRALASVAFWVASITVK
jgi:hypothetical protein